MSVDLRDASLGFYRVWYAALGSRHGLFQEAWRSPEAMAERAGLDTQAVSKWCRGAHALGLLEKGPKGYRVAHAQARRLARPDDPESLARHFQYLAAKSLTFGGLDDLMRGRRTDPDLRDVYALATGWDHVAFLDLVLPKERATLALLRKGADVLDLGAGNGAWAQEVERRYPKARVAAAETEDALPRLRKSGVPALALDGVPDASFDIVYLGEVLGAAGDPLKPLATAMRALRPGGRLHAMEGLLPPEGRAPRGWGERLILAMDLDFGMDGSRFLGVDEARDALLKAGFVRRRVRDVGGSLYHLAGVRPQAKGERRR